MALIPGQTTISQMRNLVRLQSNMETSLVCTDSEIDTYICYGIQDLHAKMLDKVGEGYGVAPDYFFTTDGTSQYYPLPTDFRALLKLDVQLWGQPNGYRRLRRISIQEASRYCTPYAYTINGAPEVYLMRGQAMELPLATPTGLTATVTGSGSGLLGTFAFQVTATTQTGETTPCPVVPATVLVGQDVALEWNAVPGAYGYNIYFNDLIKPQLDYKSVGNVTNISGLPALAGAVPGTPPLVTSAYYNGPALWLLPLAQAGNVMRLIYQQRVTLPAESGQLILSGVVQSDVIVIQGVQFQCNVTIAPTIRFDVGATDTETAFNLATAINNYAPFSQTFVATSSANVVTLQLTGIALQVPTNVSLSAAQHFQFLPSAQWSNLVDGINGWEMLPVEQACIKVLGKQDLPTAEFVRREQAMLVRLQVETAERDTGNVKTVADVRSDNGVYGGFGGGSNSFGYPF